MSENAIVEFDPFKAMDSLDDELIVAELEGRIIDKWVYHFPGNESQGEIWGLSKVGVDQAARLMAAKGEALRDEEVSYQVDPTDNRFVLFTGYASRIAISKEGHEIKLDRASGTKRQCTFIVKSGEVTTKPNTFWFEQGVAKCLRNARHRLLAEKVVAELIALAKGQGKVSNVSGGETATPPRKSSGKGITEKQAARLFAIAKGAGWDNDEIKKLIGKFGYESSKDIKWSDYDIIIKYLEKGEMPDDIPFK